MIGILPKGMSPLAFQDLIETGEGVVRRVVPAQKDPANPVLMPERSWEGKALIVPSVCRAGPRGPWQMWYVCHGVIPRRSILCYAESPDGRSWQRPELGLVEFAGSRANNIVLIEEVDQICVYRDETTPAAERYRMFLDTKKDRPNAGRIFTMLSADGLRWTLANPDIIPIRSDSLHPGLRDPYTGQWLCYHRPGYLVRTIARSESADGLVWQKAHEVLKPDLLDQLRGREHYGIAVFPYDGGFLGMLRVFDTRWDWNHTWIEAVVSRDGITWQRLADRTPLVGPGPEGSWDSGCITPGHALVPAEGGHWFYYDAWNGRHGPELGEPHARGAIGRAFIPFGRIMECVAQRQESTLTTYPLLLRGETLVLDHAAGAATLRASVRLPNGSVPEGFSAGDSTVLTGVSRRGLIGFAGGSLARFAGQPVQLILHLGRGARLFGMGIDEAVGSV